jgi:hypothetical protein
MKFLLQPYFFICLWNMIFQSQLQISLSEVWRFWGGCHLLYLIPFFSLHCLNLEVRMKPYLPETFDLMKVAILSSSQRLSNCSLFFPLTIRFSTISLSIHYTSIHCHPGGVFITTVIQSFKPIKAPLHKQSKRPIDRLYGGSFVEFDFEAIGEFF